VPALAQAPAGTKPLVVLTTFAKANVAEAETQVRQGLARLGWRVGDNLRLEFRYADNQPERLDALARELVGLQPTAALARTLRLPSGAHSQAHVKGGGLFGDGPDLTAMWQRAVQQADAVLRGQPVGEVPSNNQRESSSRSTARPPAASRWHLLASCCCARTRCSVERNLPLMFTTRVTP
jgi:hypothetical protein